METITPASAPSKEQTEKITLAEFMKTQEMKGMQQVQDLYKSTDINGSSVGSVINGMSNGNITEKKIIDILQQGFDEFKKETGREMTYSEMREMYG